MAFTDAYSKEGDGTLFPLGAGDDLRIAAGVDLLSFGSESGLTAAVQGAGSGHMVSVLGTVRSFDCAIELGGESTDIDARIIIGARGVLASLAGERGAIHVVSQAFHIANAGFIAGAVGLRVASCGPLASWIENTGVISATGEAIARQALADGEAGRVVLVNRGRIFGGASAYDSQAHNAGDVDIVHNYGRMVGDVRLGAGNDVYAAHGSGRINGWILGQSGDDVFRPGLARERMDGGEGMDRLDFSAGPAVRIALDGAFGAGRALGDTYTSFEIVYGSRRWGDWLRGSEGDEQLFGLGGQDRLIGGAGNDQLIGGTGRDTLSGGPGADDFIYNRRSEAGDVITDFDSDEASDRIVINLSGFRGGIGVDASDVTFIRSDQKVSAMPEGLYIYYNTDTGNVWLDLDGRGGEKRFFLARFIGTAALFEDDFLFIGAGSPGANGF